LKPVIYLFIFFLFINSFCIHAQPRDDSQAAQQYVIWAQQEINEGRLDEALTGLQRAGDFADVSSDVSYLLALVNLQLEKNPNVTMLALNKALETNRWVTYNENHALLMKTKELIIRRDYYYALSCLDRIGLNTYLNAEETADAAMLRILIFRGMAMGNNRDYDSVQALARFRSLVLTGMDRFPRDPRPLRIFLEYANTALTRNRLPEQSELHESDLNLLELALRRLPFLQEIDPDLTWLAAPFIYDYDTARRLVASYRAGGLSQQQIGSFKINPASIPIALNLGLIDDKQATDELFNDFPNQQPVTVLDKDVVINVYNLLRSEEGRDLFTRRLLSFSGIIISDDDNDGYIDSRAYYQSGVIREFIIDTYQNRSSDVSIIFGTDSIPVSAVLPVAGQRASVSVKWERYPSVLEVTLEDEIFHFKPADFQFAPVAFFELTGSRNLNGLVYPILSYQFINLTRYALVSFCSNFSRPSPEFEGAIETIYLDRGVPLQAVEMLNGQKVSITEFERGFPVIQYIDLDLDGRLETIRRFYLPSPGFQWQEDKVFDYRSLIASSESDWIGDGRYRTREMYLQDGSVVIFLDME